MTDRTDVPQGATLLLALHFPDLDPATTDPDALADAIAAPIAAHGVRVEVSAIPVPQWLSPGSIAAVRNLLSDDGAADAVGDHDDLLGEDDDEWPAMQAEAYEHWRSQQ